MVLQAQDKDSIYWLRCGILALALAGVYSIILVFLRTPFLSSLLPSTAFKAALVVHVNLSVLIWLLSFCAALWAIGTNSFISRICSKLGILSSLLIALSPFLGENTPITNNYVPMLENIVFILGLSLFGASIMVVAIDRILFYAVYSNKASLLDLASLSGGIVFISTWGCFIASYLELKRIMPEIPIDLSYFYELLFWSGGHILQFVYTQMVMISWIILWENLSGRETKYKYFHGTFLILNLIFAHIGLYGQATYPIISGEFVEFYTKHMKYFGGIAPVGCLSLLLYDTYSGKEGNTSSPVAKAGLICSVLLFAFGGIIGVLISEVNVTIPAHYHGAIVGISIAFIALTYILLGDDLAKNPLAARQIYILSFGQIVHISGLAIAGGYGALRKTPGVDFGLQAKVGMSMMGLGGLIAVIGGLIFVAICGIRVFSNELKKKNDCEKTN